MMSPTISSARGSFGSPCTVTSRYDPCSLLTHCADNSPGTLTHGVSIVLPLTHSVCGAAVITNPVPVVLRYAWTSALPPASAAGFVHADIMSSPGTRTKSDPAGGGMFDRNDAYVMTQPVCDADLQSGVDFSAPPTSFPFGTARLVPRRIADTSRFCTGFPSISFAIKSVSRNDPCE